MVHNGLLYLLKSPEGFGEPDAVGGIECILFDDMSDGVLQCGYLVEGGIGVDDARDSAAHTACRWLGKSEQYTGFIRSHDGKSQDARRKHAGKHPGKEIKGMSFHQLAAEAAYLSEIATDAVHS